jgi:hypothetical protein
LEVVLRPGTVRPDNEGLQRAVARTVLAHHPDLLGQQILRVSIVYVANLGTASWSVGHNNGLDAAGWRSAIASGG